MKTHNIKDIEGKPIVSAFTKRTEKINVKHEHRLKFLVWDGMTDHAIITYYCIDCNKMFSFKVDVPPRRKIERVNLQSNRKISQVHSVKSRNKIRQSTKNVCGYSTVSMRRLWQKSKKRSN